MNKRFPVLRSMTVVAALAASVLQAGCISPRSFVDPTIPKVSYEAVRPRPSPLALKLETEFQRNGQGMPRVTPTLRLDVERVLLKSGLVAPQDHDVPGGTIRVVVNNIADQGAAAAKGFGTGLTFGLVGTTVTDRYEMTVTVTRAGRSTQSTLVRHALHTAIGNTTLPEGIETMTTGEAFSRVVEQMLLRCLSDLQKSGQLAARPAPHDGLALPARAG